MRRALARASGQRGLVLVASLLLLLVVTIIAMSIFRSFGVQEKIAGNVREKQRALNAAESAQQYAEWWLSQSNNASSAPVVCSTLLSANSGQGQICSNSLASQASPIAMPWPSVGVTYVPPAMTVSTTPTAVISYGGAVTPTYYAAPQFYIADMGKSATGVGEIFKITSAGYGATTNAVAVVESTYSVYVSSWDTSL